MFVVLCVCVVLRREEGYNLVQVKDHHRIAAICVVQAIQYVVYQRTAYCSGGSRRWCWSSQDISAPD
jgi:hypothetical protein